LLNGSAVIQRGQSLVINTHRMISTIPH
jgi:hypothetical protein